MSRLLHADAIRYLGDLGYLNDPESDISEPQQKETDPENENPETLDQLQAATKAFRRDVHSLPTDNPALFNWLMDKLPSYLPEWNQDTPLTCDEADILALLCDDQNPIDPSLLSTDTEFGLGKRISRFQQLNPDKEKEESNKPPFSFLADLLPGDEPPANLKLLSKAFDRMGRSLAAFANPPAITTEHNGQAIVTRFSKALAPINTLIGHPEQRLFEIHTGRVTHFLQQLRRTLQAVMKALQWAVSLGTQPLSWVKFGMQLIQQFRQLDSETSPDSALSA